MLSATSGQVFHTGRIKTYPDGSRELLACSKPIFRSSGWEVREAPQNAPKGRRRVAQGESSSESESPVSDALRAVRRARAQVRDIALCNPMTYFVTLTLDAAKVDRYDMSAITRKLNAWLSNQVQRRGLCYVLVPERHKDGAVHFHGFFNNALPVVDSGTIIPASGGKPRKPRSRKERDKMIADGGHVVYNLPGWTLGFTTAIELYGEYDNAVSYVCKYIGKDMPQEVPQEGGTKDFHICGKIGGRWYYSGGDLKRPEVSYAPLEWRDLAELPGAYYFEVPEARAVFVKVREPACGDRGASAGTMNTLATPTAGQTSFSTVETSQSRGEYPHMNTRAGALQQGDLTVLGKLSDTATSCATTVCDHNILYVREEETP